MHHFNSEPSLLFLFHFNWLSFNLKTNKICQGLNLQITYKNVPREGKYVLYNFFLRGCIARKVDVTTNDFVHSILLIDDLTLTFPLVFFIYSSTLFFFIHSPI